MNLGMGYDPAYTKPMEDELTSLGFKALRDSNEVEESLKQDGTTLLVINSVCGCAAGKARPGVKLSLENGKKPDHLVTTFAGVDREATEKARGLIDKQPSSPSMALFKDGKLVFFMSRQDIEGREAEQIAGSLKEEFEKVC